LARQVGALRI
jgi:hypothetical protein